MADEKTKIDEPDRSSVTEGVELEIRDIAEVAGLSMEEVRQLVKEHGNDREALMAAVRAKDAKRSA